MYALVENIEAYPEFLPWCSAARVDWREGEKLEATIEMKRAGARHSFSTRNRLRADQSIQMQLIDGPFKSLQGRWDFNALGESGSKVGLELEFEFSSRMLDSLLGAFFEQTCDSMVEAFTRRAQHVYGTGTADATDKN
jgi:ribosome-associated toxin RatA of RatAB toxin-antitoxin module